MAKIKKTVFGFPSEQKLKNQRLIAHHHAMKTNKHYASLFWAITADKEEARRKSRLKEIWDAIREYDRAEAAKQTQLRKNKPK